MRTSAEELTMADYRRSVANPAFNHADFLFQKRVRDAEGRTLYFINIYQYVELNRETGEDGWMPTEQLYLDADHKRHIDVTLGGFETLAEVESFLAKIYDVLECAPYERDY